MKICGIDPGKAGGLVVLGDGGEIIAKSPMFLDTGKELDPTAYQEFLRQHQVEYAFVEQVHAIHGCGARATFAFGGAFMFCIMLPKLMRIPYQLVLPTEWQRVMHKGLDKKLKPKERSLIVFNRQWPGVDLRESSRCKNPHDGMIDALLLAEYGRMKLLGLH